VREAMRPYLAEEWGNPSSSYRFGSILKSKIETAREEVAKLIGCQTPPEILFTSGGTGSNNTAIHSAICAQPEKRHIITSQVEHSAAVVAFLIIAMPCKRLANSPSTFAPFHWIISPLPDTK